MISVGRGGKSVWVEEPALPKTQQPDFPERSDQYPALKRTPVTRSEMTRVTPAEAQRRVDEGLATVIKSVNGAIKRIRMNGQSVLPAESTGKPDEIQRRAGVKFARVSALDRVEFERVVRECGALDRRAVILPGPANPWVMSTEPTEACIVPG